MSCAVTPENETATRRSFRQRLRALAAQPVPQSITLGFAFALCLLPLGQAFDRLKLFFLFADDFSFFIRSRNWSVMVTHLFEPHHLHFCPTFRLWSWLVFWAAGEWQTLPFLAAIACSLLLALTLAAGGGLVWRETNDPAAALAAMILLGNLGIEHELTALQGAVLTLGLFCWAQGRRRQPDSRRLERVGLALCLPTLLLVCTVRSYLPFSSFVDLTWYFALPQVGFVLFLVGWWANYHVRLPVLTAGRAVLLLLFAGGMQVLQQPEALLRMERTTVALSEKELALYPTPALRSDRAVSLLSLRSLEQSRFLGLLDQLERLNLHVYEQEVSPDYTILTLSGPGVLGQLVIAATQPVAQLRQAGKLTAIVAEVNRLNDEYERLKRQSLDGTSLQGPAPSGRSL